VIRRESSNRMTLTMRHATAALLALLVLLALAPSALAAYGDDYGVAAINDGAGPLEDAPAFPGGHAFWAGTCDRALSPAPGSGPIPGGVGSRPATILVPASSAGAAVQSTWTSSGGEIPGFTVESPPGSGQWWFDFDQDGNPDEAAPAILAQVAVPAPQIPDHCIDWGAETLYKAPEFNGATDIAPSQRKIWQQLPWGAAPGSGDYGQSGPAGDYAPSWRLAAATQAGAHPDGTTMFAWNRNSDGVGALAGEIDGSADNIVVELPPGFVANPQAVAACPNAKFEVKPMLCPPQAQVGVLRLGIVGLGGNGANLGSTFETTYPVYNLEPRQGRAAELGFAYASGEDAVPVRLEGKARTGGDFGITAFTGQIPSALPPIAQAITLWGVPWAAENDAWRTRLGHFEDQSHSPSCKFQAGTLDPARQYIPPGGLRPECQAPYEAGWGEIRPFVSNETDCNPSPTVTLRTDSYQHPGAFDAEGEPVASDPDWKTYTSVSPATTGCADLAFEPDVSLQPQVKSADSPSGLDVELAIPQNNDPPAALAHDPGSAADPSAGAPGFWRSDAGLATSHLRDTVVTLPEGMTLNPAAAAGQEACSMAQIGVTDTDSPQPPRIRFDNSDPSDGRGEDCPQAAKVGTVVVQTPLLAQADWPTGEVYLAEQGDNPFGSDFAIYLAIRSPERGFIAKLAGKVEPDPLSGRLKTTFTDNPELPFEKFVLHFKGGPTAPLATPPTCGTQTSTALLTPHARPGSPVTVTDSFEVSSGPAGGCPATAAARALAPGFAAGSTNPLAGAHSPFTLRITRRDGEQELSRVQITTPEGLLATLAGVPSCPEDAIARAAARTAAGDGALEKASPSCPQASRVGSTTIGVGAGPSPFYVDGGVYLAGPYRGEPLSLAFVVPALAGPFDLGVQVVRAALHVNPANAQITALSDPIPQILRGIPLRIRDIRVDLDRPGFTLNPTDCSEQLVTGRVFGASGAVAEVANRFQLAGCERLGFRPGLSLRMSGPTHRSAHPVVKAILTTRRGDANVRSASLAMPRTELLENAHIRKICTRVQFAADACPKGSVYGYARAWSPLLDQPLQGPVYLRSSDNVLPDLVAALRGPDSLPIEVELAGRTDSKNGGIRNTFDIVPDAPVSKFVLELKGGQKSLIVNSRDVCDHAQRATVRMDAQNGRRHNFRPQVVYPRCKMAAKAGSRRAHG
jgi:hypothetical protein